MRSSGTWSRMAQVAIQPILRDCRLGSIQTPKRARRTDQRHRLVLSGSYLAPAGFQLSAIVAAAQRDRLRLWQAPT